jgi:hypothetical protein
MCRSSLTQVGKLHTVQRYRVGAGYDPAPGAGPAGGKYFAPEPARAGKILVVAQISSCGTLIGVRR